MGWGRVWAGGRWTRACRASRASHARVHGGVVSSQARQGTRARTRILGGIGQERDIRALDVAAPRRARRAPLNSPPAVRDSAVDPHHNTSPTNLARELIVTPLTYSPSLSTFSTRRRSRLPRPTSSRGLCSASPFPHPHSANLLGSTHVSHPCRSPNSYFMDVKVRIENPGDR